MKNLVVAYYTCSSDNQDQVVRGNGQDFTSNRMTEFGQTYNEYVLNPGIKLDQNRNNLVDRIKKSFDNYVALACPEDSKTELLAALRRGLKLWEKEPDDFAQRWYFESVIKRLPPSCELVGLSMFTKEAPMWYKDISTVVTVSSETPLAEAFYELYRRGFKIHHLVVVTPGRGGKSQQVVGVIDSEILQLRFGSLHGDKVGNHMYTLDRIPKVDAQHDREKATKELLAHKDFQELRCFFAVDEKNEIVGFGTIWDLLAH